MALLLVRINCFELVDNIFQWNFLLQARPVATAIAGVKPSDISALGLPIPSKLKDLSARGGSYPLKGKYGLVSLSDDGNADENVLVGPNYFAQARLSEKMINSDSIFDNDRAEVDDVDDEDREMPRQPDLDSEDENEDSKYDQNPNGDRQVEPVENSQNPFAFAFGHNPLFPPTYDGMYNYLQNPFLPPYSFNVPNPIVNQYLQRRAYNSGIRYPSIASQYPGVYGQQQQQLQAQQYNPHSPAFSPFSRFFYVQQ